MITAALVLIYLKMEVSLVFNFINIWLIFMENVWIKNNGNKEINKIPYYMSQYSEYFYTIRK